MGEARVKVNRVFLSSGTTFLFFSFLSLFLIFMELIIQPENKEKQRCHYCIHFPRHFLSHDFLGSLACKMELQLLASLCLYEEIA